MNTGVHATHCCPLHGCKYGDADCPVALRRLDPYYPNNNGCESCEDEKEYMETMTHTVKVKVKGIQHSHTEKKVFTHKPSNDEIKSVVTDAKRALKDVTGQTWRTIDTSVTPGGHNDGDEEGALVS